MGVQIELPPPKKKKLKFVNFFDLLIEISVDPTFTEVSLFIGKLPAIS